MILNLSNWHYTTNLSANLIRDASQTKIQENVWILPTWVPTTPCRVVPYSFTHFESRCFFSSLKTGQLARKQCALAALVLRKKAFWKPMSFNVNSLCLRIFFCKIRHRAVLGDSSLVFVTEFLWWFQYFWSHMICAPSIWWSETDIGNRKHLLPKIGPSAKKL